MSVPRYLSWTRRFIHGHNWRNKSRGGTGHIDEQGYRRIYKPNNHLADKDGRIKEHRLIWEQYNNASLLPWADVHHKNHNRSDNNPTNLFALMHHQHTALHHKERRGT